MIFKGVMGGGALTGYVGIRLESEMSDRQKYKSPKKNKEKNKEKNILVVVLKKKFLLE